jgi:CubicO group peptidase (beta-lactamase class C family)
LKRLILLILFPAIFISLTGTGAFAQTTPDKLGHFFTRLAKNQEFNGSVLVAEKGRILYEKSFGFADFPGKIYNTKNTSFPIASITKTITATAILQQVEKGNLRLDDTAARYLPDFPYPQITIRQLLSHTSGIPSYNAFFDSLRAAEPGRIFTNADFLAGLLANPKPLVYQPGEGWNYDNTNYIVLALLLEKVSGESYGGYIHKHILQPAGMSNTTLFPFLFDSSKNKIRNLVIPHWYPRIYADEPIRADSMPFVSSYWSAYQFEGFSHYNSTIEDILRYDRALAGGTLVNPQLLNEAFGPVRLKNGNPNPGNYGLGWTVEKDDSLGTIVYHVGGAIGLNCILYRNISRQQTVIAYDIAQPSAYFAASSAINILNGQRPPRPKKNLTRIYGKMLVTKGSSIAANTLERFSKDNANYHLEKEELIKLGYEFLGDVNPFRLPMKAQYENALEVFKQCIRLFPDYWNSFDSYGDALARTGNTGLAIQMYEKSIKLNPQNEGGKKALQKLLQQKSK